MLCSVGQRYNLKAIHNSYYIYIIIRNVVLSRSKIQSESNSQPAADRKGFNFGCAQ